MLARIAEAVQRVREEHAESHGLEAPELEDTRYVVVMMACSLFGEALGGELFMASAGLDSSDAGRRRFRRWLAERGAERIVPEPPEHEADG